MITNEAALEPELTGPTPRPVRFTEATQAVRLFLLFLLVGGLLLMVWLASRDLGDLQALHARGKVAQAEILDRWVGHGKSDSYWLKYAFGVSGDVIYGETSVTREQYARTAVGESLTVTYLPSDPETHRVGEVTADRVTDERVNWTMGSLAVGLVLGLLFAGTEAHYRYRRRLLRDGVAVVGVVTGRRAVQSKSTEYYVRYEYPLRGQPLTDPWRQGEVPVSGGLYAALREGQPLTILYLPWHPPTSLPYRTLTCVTLAGG
jgi:hypothetical protein